MIDLLDVKLWAHTFPEKLAMWIAWKLPHKLVYWCAIRVGAHATQGDYGVDCPSDVSVMDMLQRWEKSGK